MSADGSVTSDWAETSLPGVRRRSLVLNADDRGSFVEVWRASWLDAIWPDSPPGAVQQANVSRSHQRVLRGLHVHQRQADVWIVLDGRAFVGLADLRGPLTGDGPLRIETIDATPGDVLFLPEGVAHGFYAREALTLLYFVTNAYDGSDEHGFAWDDPVAAIPWPDPAPILSPRDASAPSLSQLLERLRVSSQQSDSR